MNINLINFTENLSFRHFCIALPSTSLLYASGTLQTLIVTSQYSRDHTCISNSLAEEHAVEQSKCFMLFKTDKDLFLDRYSFTFDLN